LTDHRPPRDPNFRQGRRFSEEIKRKSPPDRNRRVVETEDPISGRLAYRSRYGKNIFMIRNVVLFLHEKEYLKNKLFGKNSFVPNQIF